MWLPIKPLKRCWHLECVQCAMKNHCDITISLLHRQRLRALWCSFMRDIQEGCRGTPEHMHDSRQHLFHCEPLGGWGLLGHREISACTVQKWSTISQRMGEGWSFKSLSGTTESESSLKKNRNPKPRVLWAMPFAHLLYYLKTCTEVGAERNGAKRKQLQIKSILAFPKEMILGKHRPFC